MSKNKQLKIDACKLARELLNSNTRYLDNVVDLWKIGNSLYSQCWDTEFHTFGVIESDTDHLPLEKVRQHCSEKMLLKSDKELTEVINFYKKDVFKSCNRVLLKHENK